MTKQRIMAFIDGHSTHVAAKSLDFIVDYAKLYNHIEDEDFLVRANYYAAMPPDEVFSSVRRMSDWLSYHNFNVITKPLKSYEKDGTLKYRGSVSVEMATDIIAASRHVDHILIFSGDSDLRYAVEYVQRNSAAQVTVFSSIVTNPPMIGDELRRQADRFVDLATIKPAISLDKKAIVEEEVQNLEVELEKEE